MRAWLCVLAGMQGQLWSETVRTAEQMDYMIFPRLLALAERAWHRAEWEGRVGGPGRDGLRDWTNFANSLGYGQLRVLDHLGVAYRVGPPGAKLVWMGVFFPYSYLCLVVFFHYRK